MALIDTNAPAATISFPAVAGLVHRMVATVLEWKVRSDSRIALSKLTDEQLGDCGLGRAEAEAQIAKRFWQE